MASDLNVTQASTWRERLRSTLLGLQFRATVLVVALVFVVVTLLCAVSTQMAWRMAGKLDRQEVTIGGRLLAGNLSKALSTGDASVIRTHLDEVIAAQPFAFVTVTDSDGKRIAHVGALSLDKTNDHEAHVDAIIGAPAEWVSPETGSRLLSVTFPIERPHGTDPSESQVAGYLRVGLDRTATIQEFDATADLMVGTGIAVVLLMIPLAFLGVRRTAQPLREMASVAERFSRGDLNARTAVQSHDEIGLLGRQFNDMAENVQRKHQEIAKLNSQLERRVRERTSQLRELAARDPLTGLYNRRHFNEELTRRLAEADRFGSDMALLMFDVDDFKTVNDTLGHQEGDRVLGAVARSILTALRATDIAARFGGDEFIVLMPGAGCADAHVLAARIIDRFEHDQITSSGNTSVTLSVGISSLSRLPTPSANGLIQAADAALYDAKGMGKNQVVSADLALQ